jgi:AraC-like DNA-binding protein
MWLTGENLKRLSLARDLLSEVHESELSIERIAREIGISPFHLIRRFETAFGVTPHQFRIQARLERAKQLLASGSWSVTDACMEVGFSSVGSFSTLFTRRVGEAPSAYQRRMRRLVQVPGLPPPALAPGCLTLIEFLPRSAFRNFREA